MRELEEPDHPEEVEYLLEWMDQLYGRSGVTFDGTPAPISYQTIESWARLCDICVEPHEIEAILILDGTMRYPEETEIDREDASVVHEVKWPDKKKPARKGD